MTGHLGRYLGLPSPLLVSGLHLDPCRQAVPGKREGRREEGEFMLGEGAVDWRIGKWFGSKKNVLDQMARWN
jgi:hypothetical protein